MAKAQDTAGISVADVIAWQQDIQANHNCQIRIVGVAKPLGKEGEAHFIVQAYEGNLDRPDRILCQRGFIFPTNRHRTFTGAWLDAVIALDSELTAVAALEAMDRS